MLADRRGGNDTTSPLCVLRLATGHPGNHLSAEAACNLAERFVVRRGDDHAVAVLHEGQHSEEDAFGRDAHREVARPSC